MSASENDIKRRVQKWLIGWLEPRTNEDQRLQDLNLRYESHTIGKLRSTLVEIDGLFLAAFKRSLDVKKLKPMGTGWDEWRIELRIEETDYQTFVQQIEHDDPQASNLIYLHNETKLPLWQKAVDFLIFENQGFPGRMILKEGGGYKPFPAPFWVHETGLADRVREVERVASHLPHEIIEVARETSYLSHNVLHAMRKRVYLLDRLIETSHNGTFAEIERVSLSEQIEQSWPKNIPKGERFLPGNKIAQAYPKTQQAPSSPTTILIITISSVLSGILSVLSYLKAAPARGTVNDADFFSLLQSCIMQFSSITIMMLSFRGTRLTKQAEIYVWVLAGSGLMVSVLAVPMYLWVPTGWSTLLEAAGGIVQGFVTLLLVYSVSGA